MSRFDLQRSREHVQHAVHLFGAAVLTNEIAGRGALALLSDPLVSATLRYMSEMNGQSKQALMEGLIARFSTAQTAAGTSERIATVMEKWDRKVRRMVVFQPRTLSVSCVTDRRKKLAMELRNRLKEFGEEQKLAANCWCYKTCASGYAIRTTIDTGSSRYCLSYSQDIFSADGEIIDQGVSVVRAIGIAGQTTVWNVQDGGEATVSEAVVTWCRDFLQVLSSTGA